MSPKSEESKILSMRVTQDISNAMKAVAELASASHKSEGYDCDHSTLASGICALSDADKITRARITDVKTTVEKIDARLSNQAVFKRGPLKGLPVSFVLFGGCFIAFLLSVTVMFAIAHDQLNNLADAWKLISTKRMVIK